MSNDPLLEQNYTRDMFRMFYICLFLFFLIKTSTSIDSIAPSKSIRDGENLVSAGGIFELGFFSPGSSKGRYVGIWYHKSPSTVVWVANRETQLKNKFGVLKVNDQGVLMLVSGKNVTVWSSNISSSKPNNPIAHLLDTGNLVVRNGNDINLENLLWQSFDYPCDTVLPGMKIGWNLETGQERFISSWKSKDNPAQGKYTGKVDRRGYPQGYLLKGNDVMFTVGSWNGLRFSGDHRAIPSYDFGFVFNEKELYIGYEPESVDSVLYRYTMSHSGIWQRYVWTSQTSRWEFMFTQPAHQCEKYALCGANSVCNISNILVCLCLEGFVPKNPIEWNMSYWASGCVRRTPLECDNRDGFHKYMGMKVPDTSTSWYSKSMNLQECEETCLKNCSCTAYANLEIQNGGSGCLIWFGSLIDVRESLEGGQDLYIRVSALEIGELHLPDLAKDHGYGNFNKKKFYVGLGACALILVVGFIWIQKLQKPGMARIFCWNSGQVKLEEEDMNLPKIDLSIIVKATNNFSSNNKLGEGGFGSVYKGKLTGEQEIAVKRLSKNSCQGLVEFENEVLLIAKLQHRNLIKLLGCCIQGGEKILIYEYMPNKSLDYFIFDETQSKLLDWLTRFHIICGISRGLLYLHHDSRLRIIHRDLKMSNVLLDAQMNPKISDFGLARGFLGDEVDAKTKKVVGTYGYMPPEYALHGHFSIKSDVFSFGVIILEIVSGKKNRDFVDPEGNLNLLAHAWRLWSEERPLELVDKFLCDEFLSDEYIASDLVRCIHVGLLCVQQKPANRPDMLSVVLMLNGEKLLPKPKAPAFYTEVDLPEAGSSRRNCNKFSLNEMSLSVLGGR